MKCIWRLILVTYIIGFFVNFGVSWHSTCHVTGHAYDSNGKIYWGVRDNVGSSLCGLLTSVVWPAYWSLKTAVKLADPNKQWPGFRVEFK